MEIGPSLSLIAVGAILKFALPSYVIGINLGMIGIILMVVGAIGLAVTLAIWGPRRRTAASPDSDVVEERRVYGRRGPY